LLPARPGRLCTVLMQSGLVGMAAGGMGEKRSGKFRMLIEEPAPKSTRRGGLERR
jgi:hypothetical protein